MRGWTFVSTRNPVWRILGTGMIITVAGATTVFVIRGPRPLANQPPRATFSLIVRANETP